MRYGQGKVDENLIRQWAYNAGAFIDWYQENMQKKGLDVMVDTVCKKFSPEGIWYSPASVHTAYQPPLKETANSMGSEIAIPAMLELYEEAGGPPHPSESRAAKDDPFPSYDPSLLETLELAFSLPPSLRPRGAPKQLTLRPLCLETRRSTDNTGILSDWRAPEGKPPPQAARDVLQ